MRSPSVRRPRSLWDVLAVLFAYAALEYIVLQITGSSIVRQELVVVAIGVVLWTMWAVLRILSLSTPLTDRGHAKRSYVVAKRSS